MRRLDLKGLTFGRLKIIDYSHRVGQHLYWITQCLCGKKTFQCTSNLRSGKVVSCGCYRDELAVERLPPPTVKYELGVASFNVLFSNYARGAISRGIGFFLNKEEFRVLTSQDCHYCSSPPSTFISRRGVNGPYVYNGVDRKDSNLNYTIDNCLPCCKICNLLKMDIPYDEFLVQVIKIADRFRTQQDT